MEINDFNAIKDFDATDEEIWVTEDRLSPVTGLDILIPQGVWMSLDELNKLRPFTVRLLILLVIGKM